jgi:hypothetical protein
VVLQTEGSGILNYVGVDVHVLVDGHGESCEVISEGVVGGDDVGRFNSVFVFVNREGTDQRELVYLSDFDVGLSVEGE